MESSEGKKPAVPNIFALVFIFLLTLFVFGDIIFGDKAPFAISYKNDHPWVNVISNREASLPESFIKDPILESWPWIHYAHEQLHMGDFPLWNTDQLSGMPYLASRLTGLLNPLILIPVYFFEPVDAQVVIYFVHFLLAGFFIFLFLRELKVDSPVAILGSIAYLLQGAYIPWGGITSTDRAYFPMCMYFLERALNRRDKTGIIGFIISFWLLTITGYPQFVVYSIYVLIIWAIFSRSMKLKALGKRLIAVGIILTIAVLMGAMQHIPGIELYEHSSRSGTEYSSNIASINELEKLDSPVTLLRLFFPKFWGDYLTDEESLYEEPVLKTYIHGYAGILIAFGAFFLPLVWRNRHARIWALFFIIGCLFIVWNKIFLIFVSVLPGFRISSVKPHFMTNVAMIITACYVLNHLIANLKENEKLYKKLARVNFWMLAAIVGLVVLIAVLFFQPSLLTAQDQNRNLQMLKGAIFLWIASFSLMQFKTGRLSKKLTYALLILLTLIDLIPYHSHIMVKVPRDRAIFTTPGIEFMQERMNRENPFRIFRDRKLRMLPPNCPTLLGLQEIGGSNSMVVGDYMNFFREIDANMTVSPRVLDVPSNPEVYDDPFWDFLGVRYFASPERIEYLPSDWEVVYEDEMVIYENPDWMPRWYVTDGENIIDAEITVQRYTADQIVLEVTSEERGLLVYSDNNYPGWRLWVDGYEQGIITANEIVKGADIPAGTHTVRFLYDPKGYKVGWILAIFSLILIPFTFGYIRKLLAPDV